MNSTANLHQPSAALAAGGRPASVPGAPRQSCLARFGNGGWPETLWIPPAQPRIGPQARHSDSQHPLNPGSFTDHGPATASPAPPAWVNFQAAPPAVPRRRRRSRPSTSPHNPQHDEEFSHISTSNLTPPPDPLPIYRHLRYTPSALLGWVKNRPAFWLTFRAARAPRSAWCVRPAGLPPTARARRMSASDSPPAYRDLARRNNNTGVRVLTRPDVAYDLVRVIPAGASWIRCRHRRMRTGQGHPGCHRPEQLPGRRRCRGLCCPDEDAKSGPVFKPARRGRPLKRGRRKAR